MTDVVRQGYALARAVTRAHAKSFYFASFALWGARRRAAFALYAFCRGVDDVVDEAGARDVAGRIGDARRFVSSLYGGGAQRVLEPTAAALADTVTRYRIPEQPFQDLLSGMEMDLSPRRYQSFDELDLYCYRVAGTVGLMMAPVLGCDDARALTQAAELGKAMQLTNILRDVREDLDRGRVYLPADELAAFDLGVEDLERHVVDARWTAFMRWQIARARATYARAADGVRHLGGFGARTLVRVMGAVYGGILERIEAQGYDVFSARAAVPFSRKLTITGRVLAAPRSALAAPDPVPLLPSRSAA